MLAVVRYGDQSHTAWQFYHGNIVGTLLAANTRTLPRINKFDTEQLTIVNICFESNVLEMPARIFSKLYAISHLTFCDFGILLYAINMHPQCPFTVLLKDAKHKSESCIAIRRILSYLGTPLRIT